MEPDGVVVGSPGVDDHPSVGDVAEPQSVVQRVRDEIQVLALVRPVRRHHRRAHADRPFRALTLCGPTAMLRVPTESDVACNDNRLSEIEEDEAQTFYSHSDCKIALMPAAYGGNAVCNVSLKIKINRFIMY